MSATDSIGERSASQGDTSPHWEWPEHWWEEPVYVRGDDPGATSLSGGSQSASAAEGPDLNEGPETKESEDLIPVTIIGAPVRLLRDDYIPLAPIRYRYAMLTARDLLRQAEEQGVRYARVYVVECIEGDGADTMISYRAEGVPFEPEEEVPSEGETPILGQPAPLDDDETPREVCRLTVWEGEDPGELRARAAATKVEPGYRVAVIEGVDANGRRYFQAFAVPDEAAAEEYAGVRAVSSAAAEADVVRDELPTSLRPLVAPLERLIADGGSDLQAQLRTLVDWLTRTHPSA